MSDESQATNQPDQPDQADPDYFAELEDVRESIVDGVVTCW